MDVGLVAGLAPAQAATPARAAGAPPAAAVAAGFGTALARALGANTATPSAAPTVETPAPMTPAGIDVRQLLAAVLAPSSQQGEATTGEVPAEPSPTIAGRTTETPRTTNGEPNAHPPRRTATPTMSVDADVTAAPQATPRHTATSAAPTIPVPAGAVATPTAAADDAPAAAEVVSAETVVATSPTPSPLPPVASDVAVTRAERSMERLAPEFRTRLERVVTRMRDELGLDVRVVETFRTQDRQDALYAQGRTTTGPTVTWTRNSNHTLGLAADVRVEGADAPKAYAQLARVAAEEGLRTLGPKDPGHVEMMDGRAAARAAERSAELPLPANGIARVAQMARVAQPAAVAHVAGVAQVAVPGSRAPQPATPALPDTAAPQAMQRMAATPARTPEVPVPHGPGETRASAIRTAAVAVRSEGERGRDADVPTSRPEAVVAGAESQTAGDPLAAAGSTERAGAGEAKPAGGAAPVQGNDIAARVARLMALQDASAQAPTTGMTLMLDGENGAEARIRLGVRGTSVGATIDVADPAEAVKLGNRIGDLRRALERHGLEPATVAVRDVPGLKDMGERMQTVALSQATVGVSESSTGSRSGDTGGDRPSGQQRRDPGTAEDRPRRNPKEGRK